MNGDITCDHRSINIKDILCYKCNTGMWYFDAYWVLGKTYCNKCYRKFHKKGQLELF